MDSAGIIFTTEIVEGRSIIVRKRIKTSAFHKIYYNVNGVISAFDVEEPDPDPAMGPEATIIIKYKSIRIKEGDNTFIRYYDAEGKRQYILDLIELKDVKLYRNFEPAEVGDTIKIYSRNLDIETVSFCYKSFEWELLDIDEIIGYHPFLGEITVPIHAVEGDNDCDKLSGVGLNFFNLFSNRLKEGLISISTVKKEEGFDSIFNLIADISWIISKIDLEVYEAYNVDNPLIGTDWSDSIPILIGDQREIMIPNPHHYHLLDDFSDFFKYRESLNTFYNYFFNSLERSENGSNLEKVSRLLLTMHPAVIAKLTVERKIELLKFLMNNKLETSWQEAGHLAYDFAQSISALYLPDSEEVDLYEYLAVRLCQAFNPSSRAEHSDGNSHIDVFLMELLKQVDGEVYTFYQALYDRMSTSFNITKSLMSLSNWVFDTDFAPNDSRGSFVQAIYALWEFSKFNPYDDIGDIKPKVIGTKLSDYSEDEDALANFDNVNHEDNQNCLFYYTHEIAVSSKVVLTGYPYEQGVPSYIKHFVKWKDAAPMIIPYKSSKHLGIFNDNFSFEFNGTKIEASTDFPVGVTARPNYGSGAMTPIDQITTSRLLYGTYDIYQPVSLLNVDVETKVPLITTTGVDIEINGMTVNTLIPAFVLQYVDHMGEKSDTEKVLGFLVDGILTFSGIGNLTKLRHLRWFGFGDDLGLFTKAGLRVILGGVEFSSGVLSYFNTFIECDEGDSFCKHVKEFAILLEICTGVVSAGDTIASLAMKRKARQVCMAAGGGATDEELIANLRAKLALYNNSPTETLWSKITLALKKSGGATPMLGSYAVAKIAEAFIEHLGDKILALVRHYRREKFLMDIGDSTLGVWVNARKAPRFSRYKYISQTVIIDGKKTKQVQRTTELNDFLHTDAHIIAMHERGIGTHGLSETDVTDLILKSYRTDKQMSQAQVLVQLDLYHDYLTIRNKLLYGYDDLSQQNFYRAKLNEIINSYDPDKMNLRKYMKEYDIAGSAQYRTDPPDLDMFSELEPKEITEMLDYYEALYRNNQKIVSLWSYKRQENFIKSLEICRKQNKISADVIIRINVLEIEGHPSWITMESLGDEIFDMPGGLKPKRIDPDTGKIKNLKIDFNLYEKHPERSLGPITKIILN